MLLLRSLWKGVCVPNGIRLEVFGSLYVRDTARTPVSILQAYFVADVWIASTESNADSIGGGAEYDGDDVARSG